MEFQGSGEGGVITFGVDDVECAPTPERIIFGGQFPRRFREFAGLQLGEMGRGISSLQERRVSFIYSQAACGQIQIWFSDVERAMGHQLNGDDERDDDGHDQLQDGIDFIFP